MNARFRSGSLALVLFAVLQLADVFCPSSVRADPGQDVDINIFYDALEPYGDWVDHQTYGRVWHPRDMPPGWRPYTDGHWDYSHEHGWVWVSDWDWGWAPFHYGRWAWDDWHGWVWVPGRIWAPAWVFWRYGGGYAAWAPMPPNVIWQPEYGLITRHFSYDRDLHWDCWVAVPEYYVSHRHIRRYIMEPRRNIHVLNVTKNHTHVTIVHNTIVNRGVPVKRIEKVSRTSVRPVRIREVERPEDRSDWGDEKTLRVFRPKIRPASTEDIRRDEALAAKWSMEQEARRRSRPSHPSARFDQREVRVPDRLKEKTPYETDVDLKKTTPERGSRPFSDAQQEPMPITKPDELRARQARQPEDERNDAPRPRNRRSPDSFESRSVGRPAGIQEGDIGETPISKPRPPAWKDRKPETASPNNISDSPKQTVREGQNPIRPRLRPANRAQPIEFRGPGQEAPVDSGDQSGRFRRRELAPPEASGRQRELQDQRQFEMRRRQSEQVQRAREEAHVRQLMQEQQARQQEIRQQIEARRRQAEQNQRGRAEAQARQLRQEQQARQQEFQRKPRMEIRRQQSGPTPETRQPLK